MEILAGAIENFLASDFVQKFLLPLICIILILWVMSYLFFDKPLGRIIIEWIYGKPREVKEFDANLYPRLVESIKKNCHSVHEKNVKYLYIVAEDNLHFTSERGKHRLGIVVGGPNDQTDHWEVVYKEHILSWRKIIFWALRDQLISSPSNRNIMFSAIGLSSLERDIVYPNPPLNSHIKQNGLDIRMQNIYEKRTAQMSNITLQGLGETTLLESARGSAKTRQHLLDMAYHMRKMEEPEIAEEK